jgi:hypothetical protein
MRRLGKYRGAVGLAFVLVVALLGTEAGVTAAEDLDTGTIYFSGDGGIQEMAPDGSGRTSVAADVDYYCEPSHLPHDGRWFLLVDEVAGQTYPDGRERLELFAIHESGTPRVQLTDGRIDGSTFIEPNNSTNALEGGLRCQARWTNGDGKVSYLALRTSYDAEGNRSVQDGGVYALAVNPGNLSGHSTVSVSGAPLVTMVLNPAGTFLLAPSYAWKPDGSAVVFRVPPDQSVTAGMWRAEASNGFANPTLLTPTDGADYRWSPDGTKILFDAGLETGIKVIDADGTDETLVVADPDDSRKWQRYLRAIDWSPSGTHIVYGYLTRDLKTYAARWDLYRATATGADITDLTGSHDTGGSFPKWVADGSPPSVTVTRPTDGSTVWGVVTIAAAATDDGAVSSVAFYADGVLIGTDTSSPYEVAWDSLEVSDGEHTISVTATDDSGESASDSVVVTVDNVDDPPSVTLTSPGAGSTVSGTLTLAAAADDDGSVVKVQFFVDGVLVGTATASPWQVVWNSTTVADGAHTITAVATDDAGKTATDGVTVTVLNTLPVLTITSIAPNSLATGKTVAVAITGTGFVNGATVTFANGTGGSTPSASNVVVVSATTITASVSVSSAGGPGVRTWDVVVTNPGGASATLAGGFTVIK